MRVLRRSPAGTAVKNHNILMNTSMLRKGVLPWLVPEDEKGGYQHRLMGEAYAALTFSK